MVLSHTFVESDHRIISMIIFILPLIQEGFCQSVTSESMCTKYWLTTLSSLPRKKCVVWDVKPQTKQEIDTQFYGHQNCVKRFYYAPAMTMAGALSVTPVHPYVRLSKRHPLSKANTFDQNFMKLGHIV